MKLNKEILNTVRRIGKAIVRYRGIEFLLCRRDIYKIEVKRNNKAVQGEELNEIEDIDRYLNIKFIFNRVFGENEIFMRKWLEPKDIDFRHPVCRWCLESKYKPLCGQGCNYKEERARRYGNS
jgi:hypothetical protein